MESTDHAEPQNAPTGSVATFNVGRYAISSDLRDLLCLSMVSGVGPNLFRALVERLGSPTAVLDAPLSRLRDVPGIGTKLAERIAAARREKNVEQELAECDRLGVRLVTTDSEEFPASLKTIPSPPAVLYVRGTLMPRDMLAVALVGSRHCTHYGLRTAERLANSLARIGFTIVSGLARGIDAAAHRGALAGGGRTIAVLASGVGNIYPPEHADLAEQILKSGALVSEMPTHFEPIAGLFPQRNRIISGLSLGVIVVEAAQRSGALITTTHAKEQNREVFAVPGPVDSLASRGCHALLRDGATLVESAADVLDALGPLMNEIKPTHDTSIRHPLELVLNEIERKLLDVIGSDAVSADELVARCQMAAPQVLSTLSVLEMRRLVRRMPGNVYARR
jgi:DNA processing protein